MKIEPLPLNVRSYLRSGVAITSVTQCVEELVLNSLDAGSTCVAVRLDLNCFKVQVVDNGSGVPSDQLEILGNRFCTSKCHAIEDLDNLCHFGYRGEALASIRDSCGIFEITSRSKLSSKTYCKIFQNGKSLKVAESTILRPSVGTTITVHELFSNFPVRQKSMNKNLEMERIKEMLEGIALIRPGISFTLRNDSTGQMVLSTRKCVSVNSTFGQLYGSTKAEMLVEVRGSKQIFHVHGYVGREGHQRKNLQFIYINGRIVKKSKIHKLLNRLLLNLPALKTKQRAPSNSPLMLGSKQNLFSSPPKFSEAYPVYVLEIKCPISEYDITFEPAKTMVEFKDWDTLLDCVEEIITSFLDKENIVVKTNEIESRNNKEVPANENDMLEVQVISVDNMKDMLSSKMVKKVTNKTNINIVNEAPEERNYKEDTDEDTTTESSESTDAFRTPACNTNVTIVQGLGNRKIGEETDTESEIETTATTNDTSSIDESFDNKIQKSVKDNCVNSDVQIKSGADVEKVDRGYGYKQTTESSLSKFRQSIGKFTGKTSKKVNIDESLKKLNRIMPSLAKSNSKTLFSSLQRFRRKVDARTSAAETEINQELIERPQSPFVEAVKERYVNTLQSDYSETMPEVYVKAGMNRLKVSGPDILDNETQLADVIKNHNAGDALRRTEGRKASSIVNNKTEKGHSFQDEKFVFLPCYVSIKDDVNCNNMFTNGNRIEAFNEGEPAVQHERSLRHNESLIPEKRGNVYDIAKLQSVPNYKSCFPETDQRHTSDTDVRSTISERKRPCLDSDSSPAPEKLQKYTARPLAIEQNRMELTYNQADCDSNDNMCNTTICDNVDIHNENIQTSENENNLDIHNPSNEVFRRNDLPQCISTDGVLPQKHQCSEGLYDAKVMIDANVSDCNYVITNNDELETNEDNGFITSTQAFTPRLSPQTSMCNESDCSKPKSYTPESTGFSPKVIIETDSPCSIGFCPSESIQDTDEQSTENIERKEEMSVNELINDSVNETSFNFTQVNSKMESEILHKEEKEMTEKTMFPSTEDQVISDTVTLTQLFKSPIQKTEEDRSEANKESDTSVKNIELMGYKRKGFSFGDLFSQTPTCSSINVDSEEMDSCKINNDNCHDHISNACTDCEIVTSTSKCTQKGNNMDIGDVDRSKEVRPESAEVAVEEDNEWSDSPWDISDSSFYLRDEMKLKDQDVPGDKNQESNGSDGHEGSEDLAKVEREDSDKAANDDTIFDDENLHTMDNLNAWYKNLDNVKTGTSDILQSNKPSDVVRKLHACRFSKDSLKSVKVLGQLDRKFIACLMNTEQQCSDTDMLVLIDQHAAHERIRLEILTEDAFVDGVKGEQLAPFVVDPPQSMTFPEHEVKTVLSFLDGYQKLGIKMKEHTSTSMLISSVPACLVDREKNNKIYWSTIQVLIREHIAVFMSTQVSCGVLPQTIHKVLCSLACHGAIKFGDKLAADECNKLIRDLSRCDLPFQCAHGRPSVTPLFQIDKLQSLSCSKHKGKPKLWKLRQTMKMESQ